MNQFLNKTDKTYDLEERTAKFGENLIDFIIKIKKSELSRDIIRQLIRAATSIGANYCEANAASSKKDFRNKIFICKKEANEAKYWLRMLARVEPDLKEQIKDLWKEAHQFHLIFQKITGTIDRQKKQNNV